MPTEPIKQKSRKRCRKAPQNNGSSENKEEDIKKGFPKSVWNQWEATRRKKFNDVLESLKTELSIQESISKQKVLEHALSFIQNAKKAKTHQDNSYEKMDVLEKRLKFLLLVLQKTGILSKNGDSNHSFKLSIPVVKVRGQSEVLFREEFVYDDHAGLGYEKLLSTVGSCDASTQFNSNESTCENQFFGISEPQPEERRDDQLGGNLLKGSNAVLCENPILIETKNNCHQKIHQSLTSAELSKDSEDQFLSNESHITVLTPSLPNNPIMSTGLASVLPYHRLIHVNSGNVIVLPTTQISAGRKLKKIAPKPLSDNSIKLSCSIETVRNILPNTSTDASSGETKQQEERSTIAAPLLQDLVPPPLSSMISNFEILEAPNAPSDSSAISSSLAQDSSNTTPKSMQKTSGESSIHQKVANNQGKGLKTTTSSYSIMSLCISSNHDKGGEAVKEVSGKSSAHINSTTIVVTSENSPIVSEELPSSSTDSNSQTAVSNTSSLPEDDGSLLHGAKYSVVNVHPPNTPVSISSSPIKTIISEGSPKKSMSTSDSQVLISRNNATVTLSKSMCSKSVFSSPISSKPLQSSIFSLTPINSFSHPFTFCPLSLPDAPTTFSFTLTSSVSTQATNSQSKQYSVKSVDVHEKSMSLMSSISDAPLNLLPEKVSTNDCSVDCTLKVGSLSDGNARKSIENSAMGKELESSTNSSTVSSLTPKESSSTSTTPSSGDLNEARQSPSTCSVIKTSLVSNTLSTIPKVTASVSSVSNTPSVVSKESYGTEPNQSSEQKQNFEHSSQVKDSTCKVSSSQSVKESRKSGATISNSSRLQTRGNVELLEKSIKPLEAEDCGSSEFKLPLPPLSSYICSKETSVDCKEQAPVPSISDTKTNVSSILEELVPSSAYSNDAIPEKSVSDGFSCSLSLSGAEMDGSRRLSANMSTTTATTSSSKSSDDAESLQSCFSKGWNSNKQEKSKLAVTSNSVACFSSLNTAPLSSENSNQLKRKRDAPKDSSKLPKTEEQIIQVNPPKTTSGRGTMYAVEISRDCNVKNSLAHSTTLTNKSEIVGESRNVSLGKQSSGRTIINTLSNGPITLREDQGKTSTANTGGNQLAHKVVHESSQAKEKTIIPVKSKSSGATGTLDSEMTSSGKTPGPVWADQTKTCHSRESLPSSSLVVLPSNVSLSSKKYNTVHSNSQPHSQSYSLKQQTATHQGNSRSHHLEQLSSSVNPQLELRETSYGSGGNISQTCGPVGNINTSPRMSNNYDQTLDCGAYIKRSPCCRENRQQCQSYCRNFPGGSTETVNSCANSNTMGPFMDQFGAGLRSPQVSNSDQSRGFSVSHLVSRSGDSRKPTTPLVSNQKSPNTSSPEDKRKDSSKAKGTHRKVDPKPKVSAGTTKSIPDNRHRSPVRSVSQSATFCESWNSKHIPNVKQNYSYTAETLIGSQGYGRSNPRQTVPQNYHFMPHNQMYQGHYSPQQFKSFPQSSINHSNHDRNLGSGCGNDYNFQLHPQSAYGTNMSYMPSTYPYQNIASPASAPMLSTELMPPAPSYSRFHDIVPDQSNFSSNPSFPFSLDSQEVAPPSNGSSSMTLRGSSDPSFGVPPAPGYYRANSTSKNSSQVSTSVSSYSIGGNCKRMRLEDIGQGSSNNFLDSGSLSHVALHSLAPPSDDGSNSHPNLLAGSRQQNSFFANSDNLMVSNINPQYGPSIGPMPSNVNTLGGIDSPVAHIDMAHQQNSSGGAKNVNTAPPIGSVAQTSFDPYRLMDRQQMNNMPAPQLSSSLSNFNLTSIIPEIDSKAANENELQTRERFGHVQGENLNHSGSMAMSGRNSIRTSLALNSNFSNKETVVPSQTPHSIPLQRQTANTSTNTLFPSSHQMGISINSSFPMT